MDEAYPDFGNQTYCDVREVHSSTGGSAGAAGPAAILWSVVDERVAMTFGPPAADECQLAGNG